MKKPLLPEVVAALAASRNEYERLMMDCLLQDVSTQPDRLDAANASNRHSGSGRKATMRPEHNFPDKRAERAFKAGRKAGKKAFLDKLPKPSTGEFWWLKGWQDAYDEGVELVSRKNRQA